MNKIKVAINRSWEDKARPFDDNIPYEDPAWEQQGNIAFTSVSDQEKLVSI
jgi:hypothetical protein